MVRTFEPRISEAHGKVVHEVTHYCPTCQTAGKLLAEPALSRLLRKDWPKTLAELDERLGRQGLPSTGQTLPSLALSDVLYYREPPENGCSMSRDLSPREAHALMTDEGYAYVDVRTEQEFAAGHPEGAVNVPGFLAGPGGMMPNPIFLQVIQHLYETDAKLLFGCAVGGRSSRVCQILESSGYTNISNVSGGYNGARDRLGQVVVAGWESEGLPTSTDGATYAQMQTRARES